MPMPRFASAAAHAIDQKMQRKADFQEELGWAAEPKRPMIVLPAGMSEEFGAALFEDVLPGLLTLPVEIVIVGKGSATSGKMVSALAAAHPHRIAIIRAQAAAVIAALTAADMALFLTVPRDLHEFHTCLRTGAVPIAPAACPGLTNYDPNQESGNAFTFEKSTAWHCFAALVRACETYRFPFDWKTIQKHGLEFAA